MVILSFKNLVNLLLNPASLIMLRASSGLLDAFTFLTGGFLLISLSTIEPTMFFIVDSKSSSSLSNKSSSSSSNSSSKILNTVSRPFLIIALCNSLNSKLFLVFLDAPSKALISTCTNCFKAFLNCDTTSLTVFAFATGFAFTAFLTGFAFATLSLGGKGGAFFLSLGGNCGGDGLTTLSPCLTSSSFFMYFLTVALAALTAFGLFTIAFLTASFLSSLSFFFCTSCFFSFASAVFCFCRAVFSGFFKTLSAPANVTLIVFFLDSFSNLFCS